MEYKLTAVLVIEMLGRPVEHLASAMEQLVERLGNESQCQIEKKKIFEPKESGKASGMFFSFAEVEIKVSELSRLAEICFSYMPSSVEIINPYEIKLTLNEANAVLNLLVARLHNYDSIAKRLTIENTILQNQLRQAGIIRQQLPQQIPVTKKSKPRAKAKTKPSRQKPKPKKKSQ
ncbi:MAG: hypothetical protein V1886_02020 [archaeon]